jgi:hypothetical protein
MIRRSISILACIALCWVSIPLQALAQTTRFSERDMELARLVTNSVGSREYWQFLIDLERHRELQSAPQKLWKPGMPLFSERDMELARLVTNSVGSREYWQFLIDLELQRAGGIK